MDNPERIDADLQLVEDAQLAERLRKELEAVSERLESGKQKEASAGIVPKKVPGAVSQIPKDSYVYQVLNGGLPQPRVSASGQNVKPLQSDESMVSDWSSVGGGAIRA
jgi:hypothetical protein